MPQLWTTWDRDHALFEVAAQSVTYEVQPRGMHNTAYQPSLWLSWVISYLCACMRPCLPACHDSAPRSVEKASQRSLEQSASDRRPTHLFAM